MRNKDYWEQRFTQLRESLLHQGDACFHELEREYRKAEVSLEKDISAWYRRFAKNNAISLVEAKRLLNTRELEEFRWTVEEYIQKGKENALDGQWMKQLENASARVHISRLEALKLQIQQQCEMVCGRELDGIDRTMRRIYTDGYYRTAFALQRGMGVGTSLMELDGNKVKKMLSRPWTADGRNFSDRIWSRKTELVNTLHTELIQMTIRGDGPDKAVENITKKFHVSKGRAQTLIQTESAFFASASQQDCFKDLDVEQYEVVETLDGKTCGDCGGLDGKVFPMSEFKPGVTAPPFHPRCRGCTAPYFDDNPGERAARDENGRTTYVPSDMKYPEWKKKFVVSPKRGIMRDENPFYQAVTQKAIEKVQLVRSALLHEEQNQILQQKHKELLQFIQDDPIGTEAAAVYDMQMKELFKGKGGIGKVKVPHFDQPFLVIHNHPSGYTFALDDVARFLEDSQMEALTVVGHNGAVYLLEKMDGYNASGFIHYINQQYREYPDFRDSPKKLISFMDTILKGGKNYGIRYTKSN